MSALVEPGTGQMEGWRDQLRAEACRRFDLTYDFGMPGGWLPRLYSPVEPCESCGTPVVLACGASTPRDYDERPVWCQLDGVAPFSPRLGLVFFARGSSTARISDGVTIVLGEHTPERCRASRAGVAAIAEEEL